MRKLLAVCVCIIAVAAAFVMVAACIAIFKIVML